MGNRGNTRYGFVSSFTNLGFKTFIPDLVVGIKKVFILKGAPGTGKSTFIRLVGEALSEQGYDIEYWVSSLDPVRPDGVYSPQLDTAVINGSLSIPVDPQYPQVRDIMINLSEYSEGIAVDGLIVEPDHACPAAAHFAAGLGTCQLPVLAQQGQQPGVGTAWGADGLAVQV